MKIKQLNLVILATSGFTLAGCNSGNNNTQPASVQSTVAAIASLAAPSCTGIATWNADTAYGTVGTAVVYNGVEYTNNWWTQGNQPDTNSGVSGSGKPWTKVATCGTPSPSPTPAPQPSPSPAPSPSPTTLIYPAGIGSYIAGTVVQGKDSNLYTCTIATWCNGSSAYYAPVSGLAWQQAWTLGGGSGPTPSPTATPTPSPTPTVSPTPTPSGTPTPRPAPSPTPLPPAFNATGSTVAGWPASIAMGAIGGPNITTPTATSTGGNDDFGGRPVDIVFKYAGVNGNGDPGVIDPPTNAIRMTSDLTALSKINGHASRVAIVEYTAQMSGGANFADFTNTTAGASTANADASYIMARHFASLTADAIALATNPVVYNNQSYYGSLIMNPDLLGALEQSVTMSDAAYIPIVNQQLPAGAVNTAVDEALCLMTTTRSYTNTFNPNGLSSAPYLNAIYTGTPVSILMQMLADGYPEWSIDGANDQFWNSSISNPNSAVGTWFNSCLTNPTYNKTKYVRPNFPAGFEGWVQANNWLIRTFAAKGTVTFGWQDNMWAVGSGFWVHNNLTTAQIAANYSTPVSNWLSTYAPSTITTGALGSNYKPDYFLFDRYEMDDSASPGMATLYNAEDWDNFLSGVGQVSQNFNNIPVMLWQIPGSHIPYVGEANPELYNNTAGSYVFSTAPVYFFGDSNLNANLSNMILGASGSTDTNTSVGNYLINCSSSMYACTPGATYQQYLLTYQGKANNFNWGQNNGKLALAAQNNVFAILWGGGNTTNVIKNFSNTNDNGWLANKLINYYKAPQVLVTH
jgi:hypothetical protein